MDAVARGPSGRGERLYAGLIALAAGGFIGWVARNASEAVWVGALLGLATAAPVYWLMTRRLRSDAQLLAEPVPEPWADRLEDALPYFRCLPADEREGFLKRVQVFLADQRITGVGCEPTDDDRLLLAGTAVMMATGLGDFRYPHHREFLVYPTAFDETTYEHHEDGDQVGQVLHAGPVILSLDELRRGFTDEDWTNVAVHELAHVLDALWSRIPGDFESEYDERLGELLNDPALQAEIRSGESPIDDYALEDPQEFFAVTSEVFFEDPLLLRDRHPDVYAWLVESYRQDPAQFVEAYTDRFQGR